MATSHKDHDHPNTPAARAKCRKEMAKPDASPLVTAAVENHQNNKKAYRVTSIQADIDHQHGRKPAQMTVVPRTRGDGGVVKGMVATGPGRKLKRPGTKIKSIGDLADMPQILGYGVRLAWGVNLDVVVGERFNEAERRVVIKAQLGEISLVWRESNPTGISAIWVRNYNSSRQFKMDGIQHAFEVCAPDSEAWDQYGNLK